MKHFSVNFVPAKYFPGKDARVEYYFLKDGQLKRERIRVNRVPSKMNQRQWATYVVKQINELLYAGKNPKYELNPSSGVSINKCLEYYVGNFMPERPDSIRTYTSIIKIFSDWCNFHKLLNNPISEITHKRAIEFLSDAKIKRILSPRTYNNYLTVMRTIFNKLKEHQFVDDNPFINISKKKARGKNRDAIPNKTIHSIKEYFEEHEPNMVLPMKLLFYCGIRPTELCRLQVRNVRTDLGIIYIDSDQAKDHDSAPISLPLHVLGDLLRHIENATPNSFLFSADLKPGRTLMDARVLSRKWSRMRSALHLSERFKLYSLKDSGALTISTAISSPVELKDQFRHSSLDTTSIYIQKARPVANPNIVKMNESW